ncbi:MAG: hypothetical protein LUH50_22615, partial [Bacteroides intestinalis]|nr:hypothetical protein [Bacteroides intestinalis]
SEKPPYLTIWGLFVFIPPTVPFNSPPHGGRVLAGRCGRQTILPINNKNREPFSHLLPWLLFADRKGI